MSPPAENARSPAAVMITRVTARVVRPGVELARERAHHLVRDRVERLRPVERDDAGGAAPLEQDVGVGNPCAAG